MIHQVEMTSCGLNGGPLNGSGEYEARIACNLSGADGADKSEESDSSQPYFTQNVPDCETDTQPYIANMQDGAWAGFKYFQFAGQNRICVWVRGNADGVLEVCAGPQIPGAGKLDDVHDQKALMLHQSVFTDCIRSAWLNTHYGNSMSRRLEIYAFSVK